MGHGTTIELIERRGRNTSLPQLRDELLGMRLVLIHWQLIVYTQLAMIFTAICYN